jgi:hypothetical protein
VPEPLCPDPEVPVVPEVPEAPVLFVPAAPVPSVPPIIPKSASTSHRIKVLEALSSEPFSTT